MSEQELYVTRLQAKTVFLSWSKGSFPWDGLLQAAAEMEAMSATFLPFSITSFIFPTHSTSSIGCLLWGKRPSQPVQLSSDFAYAESQVTLAQPGDEYSSSLFSCAVDAKC